MFLNLYTKMQTLLTNKQKMQKMASLLGLSLGFLAIMAPETAFAYGLPWENPIRQVAASLCGPVARGIGIVALVAAGLLIAFGEVKGWIHNMMIVLIGVSIAVLAPSFLSMLGVVSDIACN